MFFHYFFDKGLAQNSYLIGCQATGEAIVIDPLRDIERYLETAAENELRITHIAETHIHADFLSGSRELAAATGAGIYLSDEGGEEWAYRFDHVGLKEGSSIAVGNLRLDVLHTPGHTPEHVTFVLYDLPAGELPMMTFTGDFVFVGDVGRPDLLEEAAGIKETKVIGARQMFASLQKFRSLPDHVQVWPGHGAGSACGKALGAVPSSTVGFEKATNWALQIGDESEFVDELLAGQPEPPYYFKEMKLRNRAGAPVLGTLPEPALVSADGLREAIAGGAQLVDTRSRYAWAGGHIRGSIALPFDSGLSTWAGWTLEFDTPIVLIADRERVDEIVRMLVRIGLDQVTGYTEDVNEWVDSGETLVQTEQISAPELAAARQKFTVLDVRGESEFDEAHIEGALNIHTGRLPRHADQIPTDRPIVVHCQTGYRSTIASSLLERMGIGQVHNLTGGYASWETLTTGSGLGVDKRRTELVSG
jgi:hydroxyacylglutathione hydrolase